ncbi:MAG TPA: EAL domain-containing protein [Pseudonocardiaceae bacterium]|jgi:diguanylate cyclase (GGDEF)-like protein/PAS domain S-box-containing protein|nr:EAL domain-containing protein [Pseudonocardiaceae bacterium]
MTDSPDVPPPPEDPELAAACAALGERWAQAVYRTAYSPVPGAELVPMFESFAAQLIDALRALPFSALPAEQVGGAVVEARFTGPTSLRASVDALTEPLLHIGALAQVADYSTKVVSLLAGLCAGYAAATREWLFGQQEQVKQALLRAMSQARRELAVSESRFREVFARSAVGMAISTPNGAVVEVNPKLAEILGYQPKDIEGRPINDFFHEDEVADLSASYQGLFEHDGERFRKRRRLVRADGQTAWVYLLVSVLRDAEDGPGVHLTMIEDVSDLHLLQGALSAQSLHDALTGLPNRHHLISRLESMLGESTQFGPKGQHVALYLLDLDGFSVINNGLGMDDGDRLLKAVAKRLESLFAQDSVENDDTLVARVAGDEFAVLIRSAGPPDVLATVGQVNEELAEPLHLPNGGVAVSASIGVAHSPVGEINATELLRAADVTLRRIQSQGKRQWAVYDRYRDRGDRANLRLAAALPGALEFGELAAEWLPWKTLAGDRTVGAAIRMRWDHPEQGFIEHDRCTMLAEQTGASLPVGAWLLDALCDQVKQWHEQFDGAAAGLGLTALQAADPDLVGLVDAALDRARLDPSAVWLGLPVKALASDDGEAYDNLDLLSGLGVSVLLTEVGSVSGDLVHIDELPVKAVQLAPWFVHKVAAANPDSLTVRAAEAMVRLAGDVGVATVVADVRTAEEAAYWHSIGATAASGPHFGQPVSAEGMVKLLNPGRGQ